MKDEKNRDLAKKVADSAINGEDYRHVCLWSLTKGVELGLNRATTIELIISYLEVAKIVCPDVLIRELKEELK